MKPTEKQIQIIDTVQSILDTWKSTNDINSPSHTTYIDDTLFTDLSDVIGEYECDVLSEKLTDLLSYVSNVRRHEVGDTVTIRSLDWYNSNKDEYGHVGDFVEPMSKYCGKKAVITEVFTNGYFINLDSHNWYWEDSMFED